MLSLQAHPRPPRPGTRCWTLQTRTGPLDVEVTVPDDERLNAVLLALGDALGESDVALWSGSTQLPPDLALTARELAHGAVLGIGGPGPRHATAGSALELQVTGGRDAGCTLPLGQGEHVVGRSARADVVLSDPDVSRSHLRIRVDGAGLVTVADAGSTNGSTLDGAPLGEQPVPWPVGAVVRVGGGAMTVAGPRGYPMTTAPGPAGRRILSPAPRVVGSRSSVEICFPRPPGPAAPRRLAWISMCLPAAVGVAMATVLHAPSFLFFALLSPVMALGTWVSDRWSGRRSGRRDRIRFASELRAAQERLTEAVRADTAAVESAHPDLAAVVMAARRRSQLLWSRRGNGPETLTVRVGTGPGDTVVTQVGPDGARSVARADHFPAVVDLRVTEGLAVVGPRALALGVLRGVLAQLVTLHPPGEVTLQLLVTEERLADWSWARWLPHLPQGATWVRPAADPGNGDPYVALEALLRRRSRPIGGQRPSGAAAEPGWVLVVVDCPLPHRVATLLRDALGARVVPLTLGGTTDTLPLPLESVVSIGGETGDRAALTVQGRRVSDSVIVDELSPPSAAALARSLAPLRPPASGTGLPRRVRLLDLPLPGPLPDDRVARWSRDRGALRATVGIGAAGPAQIDLCRDGPHALVAGTTGSGKSELLQTLIASLALAHPPDRCSFLLVDYKGGAAFAEAVALPHTVGLLTDLDGQATERALRSLTAELVRRERLLAAHQVSDVASLPDGVDLARLVIVVDEFATLAEEVPAFIPGLVGIAQRGRSLGVHLVLATQRPSGVVSPDIRANCSLRICLRTTDEADSRDVLGLPDAAHLPVDRPGRALLRTGQGAPILLQVARVADGAGRGRPHTARVRAWCWPDERTPVPDALGDATDLTQICATVSREAAHLCIPPPHRPWRPPLPQRLTPAELDEVVDAETAQAAAGGSPSPERLRIGLVDEPVEQSWRVLELDMSVGGGWLAVGAPRSGRTTLLRTVLSEAVHRLGPDRLHVHALDHGGGALAAFAAGLPHAGTLVTREDPLRTVRLVARLAEEVAHRRAAAAPDAVPRLLLLVDGIESVMDQLDEFDPSGGSSRLVRLVREGAAAGLTCVLTAERAVPGGRLASATPNRLLLPLTDKSDYLVAGIPASSVPASRPPGRALWGETAMECQLVLPREPVPTPGAAPAGALRIPPLPERPVLPLPPASDGHPGARGLVLPIGPGGDEARILEVDLARSGGLLVTGPPGSGRSTALTSFAEHLSRAGVAVTWIRPRHRSAEDSLGPVIDPGDERSFLSWLTDLDGRPGVVVADDLAVLGDAPVLARVPPPGGPVRVAVLAAAGAADVARQYQGPVAALRRSRTALLLCPGTGDGDVLGIRLPRAPLPRRAGSGWLVTADAMERVQVARREASSVALHASAVRQPA